MSLRLKPAARQVARLMSQRVRMAPVTAIRMNSTSTQSGSEKQAPPPPPPPPPKQGGNTGLIAAIAIAALGGGYYYYSQNQKGGVGKISTKTAENALFEDYNEVYQAIAKKLEDEDEYEDGSYAPILLRLAWHSSGTFDKSRRDGGSGPGTMRFEKGESGYAANAGLTVAKDFLAPIQKQFPWISSGDLYTLGGVAAVQEMGGPTIRWRPGRVDKAAEFTTPDGRLPDGHKGAQHIRDIFYRMGFNDQEIVALIGAHALGRCHTDRSGYDGPWTFSPTVFTNDFFTLLLNEKWHVRKWDGPMQYQDDSTKSLMMLPTDYAIIQDKKFKEWAVKYAKDQDLFFKDFASAFEKLLELGVEYKTGTTYWTFKPRNG
ncbi:cytochrome c peroxidase, mitochondrial [Trichomonascus vanleenenianus]|uniref:peroxidase n=1 Tax=Trichomonascus vanleenenianus TaxID=2268995 RepID=UPI003ECA2585